VPRLRRLVAGVSPPRPGFAPVLIHVGFLVDKVALGHIFSGFSGFLLSIQFNRGSPHSYITRGINNRPVGGRSSNTCSRPIDMNNVRSLWGKFSMSGKEFPAQKSTAGNFHLGISHLGIPASRNACKYSYKMSRYSTISATIGDL
jgi:hypothetical protein